MNKVKVFPDQGSLALSAVEHILHIGSSAIEQRGLFFLVLAGGSTPKNVYSLLGSPPQSQQLDWRQVHIFWGDERCVPPSHPDSNYRMAKETLLDSVPLPCENIHRIPAEMDPEQASSRYQAHIRSLFSDPDRLLNGFPIFDLILLGMGDDGHTASLFPCSTALQEEHSWVTPVSHKGPPPPLVDRITLTLPVINAAAHVAFLVSGEAKAQPFSKVLSSAKNSQRPLPAQLVQPHSGNPTWFVDHPASMLWDKRTGSG
jgi:6-phosphogluconolactonase